MATISQFLHRKKSVWSPNNSDERCFALAVAGGLLAREHGQLRRNKQWFQRPHLSHALREKADNLIQQTGIDPTKAAGIREAHLMSDFLMRQQDPLGLIIHDRTANDATFFATEPAQHPKKRIALVFDGHHFSLILSEKAYMAKKRLCETCGKFYDNVHACESKCARCGTKACLTSTLPESLKWCNICRRYFKHAVMWWEDRRNANN